MAAIQNAYGERMSRKQKLHEPLPLDFDDVLTAISDEQRPAETSFSARPFLKWVGGKRSILDELIRRLPTTYTTYCELFLGGGALYFAVKPALAYLSDVNFHLIVTFEAVRDDVEGVIRELTIHSAHHSKPYFLEGREKIFTETDSTKLAAWFIYLNKTCYNGLYRVNKAGKFNVPMGSYKDPTILDEDNLRLCAQVLKNADIRQHDFAQKKPQKDAFYYVDPPYHKTYSGYDGTGFGDEQHKNLALFCRKIDAAGGFFMMSNSDTPFIRGLYDGFAIETVSASRSVSCKGGQRGKEQELLVRNYE